MKLSLREDVEWIISMTNYDKEKADCPECDPDVGHICYLCKLEQAARRVARAWLEMEEYEDAD